MDSDQFKSAPIIQRLDEIQDRLARKQSSAQIKDELGLTRYELSHLRRMSHNLAKGTKSLIAKNELSEGHARALARISLPDQDELVRDTIQYRWSVRALEKQVRARLEGQEPPPDQEHYRHIAQVISDHIGHPVTVVPDKNDHRKGRIVIQYLGLEAFESIVEQMNVPLDEF